MRPLPPLLALLLCGAGAGAAERGLFPEPTADDRILVVSPHPDDGVLCCAGLVRRALDRGAEVALVWITAGDGFSVDALVMNRRLHERGAGMIALGLRRIGEARAYGRSLGLPDERMIFLGYPDGGLAALLGEYRDSNYVSPHTLSPVIPYGIAPSHGGPVTGRNLERDLANVLAQFRPTMVFAPHPGDIHPDHAATGRLVGSLLDARGEAHLLRHYVIHARDHYPSPRGRHPDLPLEPPAALAGLPWQQFPITPAEQQHKLDALRLYHSQWEVMAPYLEAFVRRNELFLLH